MAVPSLFGISNLFQTSLIFCDVFDDDTPTVVDAWGNKTIATTRHIVVVQLNALNRNEKETTGTFGATTEQFCFYEGHLVNPPKSLVEKIWAEYPEYKVYQSDRFPAFLKFGQICEAKVNGMVGKVEVMPVEQSSLIAHFSIGIGDRLRLKFISHANWTNSKH